MQTCLGINVRRPLASKNDIELNWINFPSASQPCYNVNYANFKIFVCLFLKIVQGVFSLFHDFPPICVLHCRYFLLDPDLGQLHYFVNEQGKSQKPRGSLPLIGASVTQSDEAPHMFIVHSVNGELYKLRGKTWCQVLQHRQWVLACSPHPGSVMNDSLFSSSICGSAGMLLVGHFLVAFSI